MSPAAKYAAVPEFAARFPLVNASAPAQVWGR
jgi:hypothetical protein